MSGPAPATASKVPVGGSARRLFVLQLGAERVPKDLSIAGAGNAQYWEPLVAILVETDAGWVLLDTGMSREAFTSRAIAGAYGADDAGILREAGRAWHLAPVPPELPGWAWVLDGDPLVTALAGVGLTPEQLSLAAVSHLHVDHSGGVPTLTRAGVPIVVGAAELHHARSGAVAPSQGFHPPDWSEPGTQWREVGEDTEIAPGVWVLSTPGHTPGHLSFLVHLPVTGDWVFCADAADLGQNLLDAVACGSCTPDTAGNRAAAEASTARLLALGRAGARLIPGHDQVITAAVRHPLGGHR